MACNKERSDQLAEMAGGRLAAEASGELLEHIEACPACSGEFDLAADLVRVGAEEGLVLRPLTPLRSLPRPLVRVAMALAAAAVLLIAFVLVGGNDDPQSMWREMAQLDPPPAIDQVLRGSDSQALDSPLAERAFELYRAGDYRGASDLLARVLADAPENALAAFYLGVSRVQTGELEPAATALEKAAHSGEGLLQERSLWYLANTHVALGDVAAARAVLQRLVALDGDYLLNADELLARIDAANQAEPR